MRFIEVIRRNFPPSAPEAYGPSNGRSIAVIIEGLTPSVAREREAIIVHRLRRDLAARLGEHRLERHYVDHQRTGYRTFVRDDRDAAWLRLHVALLAERAGLPLGAIRARLAGPHEGHDGSAPDLSSNRAVPAFLKPHVKA